MSKKTASLILASGNHYLLQVKKNQRSLWDDIIEVSQGQRPLSSYTRTERNRGRTETREVSLYDAEKGTKTDQWKGLRRYVLIKRQRNQAEEIALYISDLDKADAQYFYHASRGHWSIENALHRVKDTTHQEDNNRIKQHTGALMASIASSIAINIGRKRRQQSIKYNQIFFRSNIITALNYIRT